MIVQAHAVIDPVTVVVEALDAGITDRTMLASTCANSFTFSTELCTTHRL